MSLLRILGLAPSKNDQKLTALISKSYKSVRVVGRGTVKIDPQEVTQSEEFKAAIEQAKAIVSRT